MWIGDHLTEAIVPPELTAAVIRATARIPGVVVVHDAVDDAGGHGEALAPAFDGERTELISGKNTRAYLGERSYLVKNTTAGKAGTLTAGAAVLARAVVDSAGPPARRAAERTACTTVGLRPWGPTASYAFAPGRATRSRSA
jgi:hypothetical protein